ncbi:adhesion G-protein coupled receptor G5-like [Xyrauchen texanus]|uniref:adhesion G-protein coupled receptor G5-like n=1 Tax=Xyrauchen texanus TaxID=154827 RepID=UPI002242615E|nr:adhesion G-protein coupled receptor G5-like [Xyrauchen texanus]
MKQNTKTVRMFIISCFLLILGQATENDSDFQTCGTWRHGNVSRNLKYNLKIGCKEIMISANNNTLSIQGSITAKCTQSGSILLDSSPQKNQSNFCVFWEPLLDLLKVEVNGKDHTLCDSSGLHKNCCTDLSLGSQKNASLYGIVNGSIKGDIIQHNIMEEYVFHGASINCKKKICDEARQHGMIEEVVMKSNAKGLVNLPCAQSTVIEMEEGFTGLNLTLPAPRSVPANTIPSVYLPSCLKSASRKKSKVVCTYYRNSASLKLFQRESTDSTLLDDVVGISVENEIITNLPEPVRIRFHHSTLPVNHPRRCVSLDTRKDKVMWRLEGCQTVYINAEETECSCNKLTGTYFFILVQVEQRASVHHLEALTYIIAVGCAVSLVSCLVLFYLLCKRRGGQNQSSLVDCGLVVAIFLQCLFILTGTLANVGNYTFCKITGALLHYALLSTLCWMTVKVFHTFLLFCCVLSSTLPPWVFYLAGFGVPAILVCRLLFIGDIYGLRNIVPSDEMTSLYRMCWMLYNEKSRLAHYIINLGLLAVVVSSGVVMLFYVVIKFRNRSDWKNHRVAFLSIWGLICLFGTTWVLGFLDSCPLSKATLFLFLIIISLQGVFLMLRYCALERMTKRHEFSSDGGSTGSVMLHTLQAHEKR